MTDRLQEVADQAVRESIAAEVLKAISQEHRDAVLRKSIAEVLSDYSYKRAVEEAVVKVAAEAAAEFLKSEDGVAMVRSAVESSVAAFLARLIDAVPAALLEALAGKDDGGSYSRGPGLLLKHMRGG